jgi:hypothetical protein
MSEPAPVALMIFQLRDGRTVRLIPLTFGRAAITAGSPASERMGCHDELWTYEDPVRALDEFERYCQHPWREPSGWVRHQPSNRRRRGGDPATEEVRP